jgi:hypothetical protein
VALSERSASRRIVHDERVRELVEHLDERARRRLEEADQPQREGRRLAKLQLRTEQRFECVHDLTL